MPRFASHAEIIEAAWYAVDYAVLPNGHPHEVAIELAYKFRVDRSNLNQIREIADMLIPLGLFPVDAPPVPHVDGHLARMFGAGALVPFYTCRHFDTAARNCNIHATRPNLCRRFPYGAACCYSGCTMSEDDPGYEYEGIRGPIRIDGERIELPAVELPSAEVLGRQVCDLVAKYEAAP